MARKIRTDLVITPQDDLDAEKHNAQVLIQALKKTTDEKKLNAFFQDNFEALGAILFPESSRDWRGYMRNVNHLELRNILVEKLKNPQRTVPLPKFNTDDIVKPKLLKTPEDFATIRQSEQERKQKLKDRGNEHMAGAWASIKSGLSGVASLATLSTSLRGTPYVALKSAAQLSIIPAARIVSGLLSYAGNSRASKLLSGASTLAIVGTIASLPLVDSDPYVEKIANLDSIFEEACTPDIRSLSTANVSYALEFGKSSNDVRANFAYDTMMAASRHDVPVIALHMIAYFESQKFSDMVSNNSSASNPFQMIDTTKALLLKNYGQKTSTYISTLERIQKGTATSADNTIVTAIDSISKTSIDDLNKSIKDARISGPIHDALALADTSNVAAELIALDLKDKFPNITDDNLTAAQIADITVQYYAGDHFLGAGNYNLLSRMAAEHPEMSITDKKAVTTAYDSKIAQKLSNIVAINPALLEEGMTAQEALSSIKDNFMTYVQNPYELFSASYDPSKGMNDYCLKETAKEAIPDKISLTKAAYYSTPLPEIMEKFSESVSQIQETIITSKPTPSLSEEITAAVQEAVFDDNHIRSIRPMPRPDKIEQQKPSTLASSPRPRPRPIEIN